ncbi:MAG: DUF4261 domain-containing protein [Tannerella sp.]|jgi:hypothetical protein|nr:DUF4261 domain-containing protein [Tannerella sp.]
MGFFDKFKKKNKDNTQAKSSVIISMPMFNSDENYSLEKIVYDLKTYWNLTVSEISGDDSVATFKVEDETVAIAFMPAPIPSEELDSIMGFNYLWKNAKEELSTLKSHAIVSVLGNNTGDVERFKILTKVNASILRTTDNSLGIYQGSQTLLLPKNLFLDFADFLLEDMLPIQLWVYIGIINDEKSSIYTYGMQEFGKSEVEIINSTMSGSELYDFLLSILNYIIESDVTLNDGETIGFSAEQKIKITKSKAIYLDGDSLKLEI